MKKIIIALVLVCSQTLIYGQTKVGKVTLPNSVVFSEQKMVLNGAGIREKLWIDLYAAGLYVQQKSSDMQTIIDANSPMVVKLHIISGLVSQSKMISSVNDGFKKSTTGKATETQKKKFISFFNDEIKKNHIIDIVYNDGKTTVYKNGKIKGSISGLDFKKALFGIWLSDKPVDKDLKKALLGK